MKYLVVVIAFASILSCKHTPDHSKLFSLQSGFWRATLDLEEAQLLPFIFEVKGDGTLVIQNAEERIEVDEIVITGDSIRIQTPVFEGYFSGRFRESGNIITGSFIKPSLNRVVPFTMVYGDSVRFKTPKKAKEHQNSKVFSVSGSWETVFSPTSPEDRYIAKGIFSQKGTRVTGTFRTTTGDYRFLEGVAYADSIAVSTFDGAHAFLFKAKVTDSTMEGIFYSGNHWKENFYAKRNEHYELPDATQLTFLKEGYDTFGFSFPDGEGTLVSLTDARFKNKVVVVQIMGSWCPNCLEESSFYRDYLREHPSEALEVVGLAFEYAPTEEKAFASINRLKERLNIPYPILLAQYGDSDKKKAQEKLPMLNHVLSYPTTVFIDKKGTVRRIHTGFNGKATGEKYVEYTTEFEEFVTSLIQE